MIRRIAFLRPLNWKSRALATVTGRWNWFLGRERVLIWWVIWGVKRWAFRVRRRYIVSMDRRERYRSEKGLMLIWGEEVGFFEFWMLAADLNWKIWRVNRIGVSRSREREAM